MKVLLIEPNSRYTLKSAIGISGPPLGIAYLGAYIRKYTDAEIKLVDAVTLNYSLNDIKKIIRDYKPDIIGLSVISTPSIYDVYSYAKLAKSVDKNILVVVGGQHVTFSPEGTLKNCKQIDVIVMGEGEETFADIVRKKSLENILGIVYRKKKKIIHNSPRPLIPNLDKIPFPAYDELPMDKYWAGGEKFTALVTSRGCPYGCTFCSSSRLYGKKYRMRSAKNIVSEIKMLQKKYGIVNIEIIDDLFAFDYRRLKEIEKLIKKERIRICFSCSARVNIILNNPDIPKILKSIGCHTIYIGIEAGTQRSLDIIKKGFTLNQARESMKILKKSGISVMASFVIGIPGETREDIIKTIKFAKELDPDYVQFTICTPFPGTPIFDDAVRQNKIMTTDWRKYDVLNPILKSDISFKEMKRFLHKAYIGFYMRPSYIWRQIKFRNKPILKMMMASARNYFFKKGKW